MFPLRLHAKFLFLVLGSLILFFAVLSYAIVYRQDRLLQQKEEEKQHVLAFTIYSSLRDSMLEGTPRNVAKLIDSLRGRYGLVRLEVLRKDGSEAFGDPGTRFAIPHIGQAFETSQEVSFRENARPILHTILYPLKNEQECVRCHGRQERVLGVLLISLSLEDALREIGSSSRRLAVFLAALVLAIGGVLYFLIRKLVLQPLAILHSGADRIGRGELGHRVGLSTGDEIQELAESLNLMAGRLESSYEDLENRIKKRTAQVEDKAAQLSEYSRGLAAISRLSIKVFDAEQSLDQMLDRFMSEVSRGLGYKKALVCLIDRRRAWLEVKRDSGLGQFLGISDQPLSGSGPFAALVRSGRELFVQDVSQDETFCRRQQAAGSEKTAVHFIPILTGTHEKSCWLEKNCGRSDCPAYKRENEKCWLVPNTCCGNSLIESYGDKLAYCMTCEVFPVLGVLIVSMPGGREPKRRDLRVLRILAAEMGAALENHRVYNHSRGLVKELLELHKVTAAALIDLSLDRAVRAFTNSALNFSGLDTCNFWLLSADSRRLLRIAGGTRGPDSENIYPADLPADEGILGRALRENQVTAEYKMAENDRTELGRTARLQGYSAMLVLPLRTEQRCLGAVTVHKKTPTPFLESEIATFMLLANHATMAINVCKLNEELKNQNEQLAGNINLISGILGGMSSGVMLLDMNGTVKMINDAGARLLKTSAGDIMHHRLTDAFADAEVFLKSTTGPYQETEITRPDGSKIPVGFSITHYQGPFGVREGTIVIYRDLTEIKALQAAVLNKERFAAMGQVVAGVAHEVRNPLFGISSIGQIFEHELKNPEHLNLVKALLSETKRLNRLVEDLLIYARPAKLSLAPCDLAVLSEEVIAVLREELVQKSITIELEPGSTPVRAVLDLNQMKQVLHNLMRNAIDATGPGGKITVRFLIEDQEVIFTISDTGVGIPAENICKVFDLFFTTKPKGSGLGLGICKKIVEDHGGTISAESRAGHVGSGTSITVKLPYRRQSAGNK